MKALVTLISTAALFSLSICVMIFGWGLTPQSWGWVIWGNIGALFVSVLIQGIGDLSK